MLTQWRSYDPWRELRSAHSDLDSLLGGFFPTLARSGPAAAAFDVRDEEDAYVVSAIVPGLKGEDLTIEATADSLAIKAERTPAAPEGYETRLSERAAIKLHRRVRFKRRIDVDAVEATLEDGVLTIKLSKLADDRPRQIAIKAA